MITLLKNVCVFFVFLVGIQTIVAQPLDNVRDQFFKMDKTKDGAFKLYNSLAKADLSKDPVLLAYRGATSAASAGSVSGVWNKLEYFNRGKSELEKATSIKPQDVEIRFARLATQVNAPGFLGYSGNIENDKAIILKILNNISANDQNVYLYQRICLSLKSMDILSKEEQTVVNQTIIKLNSKKTND